MSSGHTRRLLPIDRGSLWQQLPKTCSCFCSIRQSGELKQGSITERREQPPMKTSYGSKHEANQNEQLRPHDLIQQSISQIFVCFVFRVVLLCQYIEPSLPLARAPGFSIQASLQYNNHSTSPRDTLTDRLPKTLYSTLGRSRSSFGIDSPENGLNLQHRIWTA